MRELDLHCNIDENLFSLTVFLTRLLSGLTLLYITVGCLLFYREFLYNATALGFPLPVPLGIGILVAELFLAFLLILGWFTRASAVMSIILTASAGVVFFAADINKIYVALMLLLITALLPASVLGPGKISLDYKHAVRRAQKMFRG
uniref:DoxX family protein n=1 Tax=uncultured Elusimicrobia bacterium TaxID=699876 RepID=A0A650EMB4_9BACT|nr:hypothetical protein Elusimicrob2101_1720 [uncultured Elusimicrobia bacterium]